MSCLTLSEWGEWLIAVLIHNFFEDLTVSFLLLPKVTFLYAEQTHLFQPFIVGHIAVLWNLSTLSIFQKVFSPKLDSALVRILAVPRK